MSRESSLLRGITQTDLKAVVRKAFERGWVFDHMSGTTHAYIAWPPTGETVSFGTTVSARDYHKAFTRKLEKAMGEELFPKHKKGKSRKKIKMAGYSETYVPESQIEASQFREKWDERISQLLVEHKDLLLETHVLSMAPVTKADLNRAMEVIRRISFIEDVLTELKAPFDSVVPKEPTPT